MTVLVITEAVPQPHTGTKQKSDHYLTESPNRRIDFPGQLRRYGASARSTGPSHGRTVILRFPIFDSWRTPAIFFEIRRHGTIGAFDDVIGVAYG
jgi:hypothetical protein